jgi:hypothetical protein
VSIKDAERQLESNDLARTKWLMGTGLASCNPQNWNEWLADDVVLSLRLSGEEVPHGGARFGAEDQRGRRSLVVSFKSKFPFRSFIATTKQRAVDPLDASSALTASKARSGAGKITIAVSFIIGSQTLVIKTSTELGQA